MNSSGVTSFGTTIGAGTALGSITTDAPGTLTLGGNVTTTGAQTFNDPLTAAGLTFTSTGNGPITATNAGNDFTGTTTLNTTGTVSLRDANDLTLASNNALTFGTTTVGTNLSITTSNDSIGGGPLTVGGTTTFNVGTGSITFTGANDFGGLVTVPTATNISLTDTTMLNLNITATGSAVISANDVTGTIAVPTLNLTSATAIINDLTLTGVNGLTTSGTATEFTFTAGSTNNPPATVVNNSTSPVGVFGAVGSFAQSQTQAAAQTQSQAAQSSVAQVIAGEAANTFGTDSVAEQVEYGFAGDVSTAPPMAHRLTGVGIGTPECFAESRDGEACN